MRKLAPLIAQWLDDLGATHDERTVHEYELVASKWLTRWKTLGEVTDLGIADYQRARLREVARETVRKNCVALRTFLTWCLAEKALDAAPVVPALPKRSTGTPRRQAGQRRPLTEDEARRLIAKLPVWNTTSHKHVHHRVRVRDWAIVAWETGLRPATLAKLRAPEHFERGARELRLTADVDKARYARSVPLSAKARRALERCLPDEPGPIFGSHDFRELLEEASQRAIGRVVRPYDLRHSRITLWVRSGADLLGVQHLVGHRDLSTTAKYARPSAEAARAIVSKYRAG